MRDTTVTIHSFPGLASFTPGVFLSLLSLSIRVIDAIAERCLETVDKSQRSKVHAIGNRTDAGARRSIHGPAFI